MVRSILRLEGLAIFVASSYVYSFVGAGWIYFLVMFLTPDISLLVFMRDKSLGSKIYNFIHNYASAFLCIFLGVILGNVFISSYGIVVTAHTGLDRFLGFGLKYPENPKKSHIQRV